MRILGEDEIEPLGLADCQGIDDYLVPINLYENAVFLRKLPDNRCVDINDLDRLADDNDFVDWKVSCYDEDTLRTFWDYTIYEVIKAVEKIDPDHLWSVVINKNKRVYLTDLWENYFKGEDEYYKTPDSKKKRKIWFDLSNYLETIPIQVSYESYCYTTLTDASIDVPNISRDKLQHYLDLVDSDLWQFVTNVIDLTAGDVYETRPISKRVYEKDFEPLFISAYYKALRLLVKRCHYRRGYPYDVSLIEKLNECNHKYGTIPKLDLKNENHLTLLRVMKDTVTSLYNLTK